MSRNDENIALKVYYTIAVLIKKNGRKQSISFPNSVKRRESTDFSLTHDIVDTCIINISPGGNEKNWE